jgi:thiamine-phosphate pyrophosphorylase
MAGKSAETVASDVGPGLQLPPRRLYLVAPHLDAASELARTLDQSLAAADVAAVLLRLPKAEDDALVDHVKQIAPVVQAKNVALILDGHPHLVARAGADGAHLSGIDALSSALAILKPDRIAGAGGLPTRHDAMVAGERGADYVMFGEPGATRPPLAAILERIAWWAEVFEIPCVGYADHLDEVGALAAAGADFVALGEFALLDPRGPASVLRAAAERLHHPELVK